MKIYGRKRSDTDIEGLLEMEEVSISANPSAFRAIAAMMNQAADSIEKHGTDYEHEHLQDCWSGWKDKFPDIQVFNEQLDSEN